MNDFDAAGYAVAEITLSEPQCQHLAVALPEPERGRAGVRNLLAHPAVQRLLLHGSLGKYLWSVVGRDLVAVKATLFDKSAVSNWRVQWHQDRGIAVKERLAIGGYGPWSSKAGALHVEPPAEVLSQMLAIRIHIDECGEHNGPLRVIAGSHLAGKLDDEQLESLSANSTAVSVTAAQGSIILMRPLLVHSSSVCVADARRRVLHIEFAPLEAISPLKWHTAVALRRAA